MMRAGAEGVHRVSLSRPCSRRPCCNDIIRNNITCNKGMLRLAASCCILLHLLHLVASCCILLHLLHLLHLVAAMADR